MSKKECVFQKRDFKLCTVPVPKGYPQSQTHVGVAKWNENVYLSTSPFPLKKYPRFIEIIRIVISKLSKGYLCNPYYSEKYENPCLYKAIGKDGVATRFNLMQDGPLVQTPKEEYGLPAYNSDPDLFIDDGMINVLNRAVFRRIKPDGGVDAIQKIYLIRGKDCNSKFETHSIDLIMETEGTNLVSPCVFKEGDNYRMLMLDTQSAIDGQTFKGLIGFKSNSLYKLKEAVQHEIKIDSKVLLPWHMSVFSYKNHFYCIVACVRRGDTSRINQHLGEFSPDFSSLRIFETPLTDYSSYRSSAMVDDDGTFILYNATLHEKIEGSKAVDGRDIIVASCKFDEMLNILRES